MKKNLICTEDGSYKFWNIEQSGSAYRVTYGKIGTSGTVNEKQFDSEEQTTLEIEKLIKSKIKKGYVEEGETQPQKQTTEIKPPVKQQATKKEEKVEKIIETLIENVLPDAIANDINDEYSYEDIDMSGYPIISMALYETCVNNGRLTAEWFTRYLNGFEQFFLDNNLNEGTAEVDGNKVGFTAYGMKRAILKAAYRCAEKNKLYKLRVTAGESVYETEFVLLDEKTSGIFKYLEFKTIAISDVESENISDLNIPCTINGKPVDTLMTSFMMWKRKIKTIKLPSTLRVLGNNSLSCCDISEITIPKNVISIGVCLFESSEEVKTVKFECPIDVLPFETFIKCKQLTTVVFTSVKKLGVRAFSRTGLTQFSFDGVEEIGEEAFCDSNLKTVVLSDSVKKIGQCAFSRNSDIKSIHIGKNVEVIEFVCFPYDTNADNTTIAPENKHFTIDEKGFYGKDGELLCAFVKNGIYEIDDNIKRIGSLAFINSKLQSITLGAELEYIDDSAFAPTYSSSPQFHLTEIKISQKNKHFKLIDDCLYSADGKRLIMALDTIKKLVVQDGTTHICSGAFYFHSKLREVTLPDSVEELGYSSFFECIALHKFKMSKNIKRIHDFAFYFCQSLPEIELYNVEHIGPNAFRHNVLANVSLGDGIRFIGESAFAQSKRLQLVRIGSGDTLICENAFEYCENATTLHIGSGNKTLMKKCFANNDNLNSITFENGTLEIGNKAFYDCECLQELTLPATLVSIGKEAFRNTKSLKNVTFPDSLESIGAEAFQNSGLDNVVLGKNIKYINAEAFDNTNFKTFHISASLEFIGMQALNSQKAVTITLDTANPYFVLKNGLLMDKAETAILKYIGTDSEITLPDTVNRICNSAFEKCSTIKRVKAPQGLEYIDDNAFQNSSIANIELQHNLKSISAWAFAYCQNLTEVNISGAAEIGRYAFYQCLSLKTVTMQSGTVNIETCAFKECVALQSLTLSDTLRKISSEAFKDCRKLKDVTIPNSVKEIGNLAFSQCGGLTKLTLGSSLTTIGASAFEGARKLTGLIVPKNIKCIEESAFKNAKSLATLEIQGACKIGNSCFNSCDTLKVLELKDTPLIANSAFKQCKQLEIITIDGKDTVIEQAAFAQCGMLKSLNMKGVKSLGASSFEGAEKLETVVLGDGIDTIGKKAFNECGVTNISIAETLTSLNDNAFANCKRLSEITLPSSIKKIGGSVFHGFTSNQQITIPKSVLEQKGINALWKAGCQAKVIFS